MIVDVVKHSKFTVFFFFFFLKYILTFKIMVYNKYSIKFGGGVNLLDKKVIEDVLYAALSRGGDFAEIFVEDRKMEI